MNKLYSTFFLENFEGPLELLLQLIQKEEVDICSVAIQNLTAQLLNFLEDSPEIEMNSETLSLTATLLLIKSQKLLPQEERSFIPVEEESRSEIIHSLLEYCRVKETAKHLALREASSQAHFLRSPVPFHKELGPGIEEMSIDDLRSILEEILERSNHSLSQTIKDEEWQVAHQLAWLQNELAIQKKLSFNAVFDFAKSRAELIVLLLALLEMMKHQEAKVVKENEILYIVSDVAGTQSH